ncbi:MAG: hypothetical protein PHD21_03315 [Flavobacteriales bacterium]|nr:hypothetical protein [Flavobacteriales bacterium]
MILPTIAFDPNRVNPAKPKQYLDNPSVYMGGTMGGQETDIGMTWEVIKDANGNVSQDRVAFRPFMRKSGITGDAALYANAPAEARYYWYQGEEITMSVRIEQNGYLKFVVDGAGKHYETSFQCAGYRIGAKGVFKRVNAIDQVSNEGKPAQATKTVVSGSLWKNTYLYRRVDGKDVKVPMHSRRMTDMRCPDVRYFIVSSTDEQKKIGSESITIDGSK